MVAIKCGKTADRDTRGHKADGVVTMTLIDGRRSMRNKIER